jgi:hypothetical protein
MKSLQILLAVVVLTCASGAIWSAYPGEDADHPSGTLYTPTVNANDFRCNATNVSQKTLDIVLTVIDAEPDDANADGTPNPFPAPAGTQNPSPTLTIPPGAVGSQDAILGLFPAKEGYCKIEVFGTGHRDDVRAALTVRFTTTFLDPITNNPTGAVIVRTLEGH